MSSTQGPMINYDFDPRNLPPEYLRAIGLVAAASAQTESVLQQFIGSLLGIDNAQTLALTLHMSFPLKRDIIRSIAELDAPNIKLLDQVDELMEEVTSALDKRNITVHNSFARNPTTGEVLSLRERARGSLVVELTPISVEEIEQDASIIYEAGIKVMDFMIRRGLEPRMRTIPLREPVNRGKKAREDRRSEGV